MGEYAIIRVKKEKDKSVTILRNADDNLDVVKIISDDKHKVVPIEPTEEIIKYCCDLGENKSYFLDRDEFREFWDLFIKAAPKIEDL